jgi:hypothetical protein
MPPTPAVTHIDTNYLNQLKAQLQMVLTEVENQLKGIGASSAPNLTGWLGPVDTTLGVLAGATGSAIGTALNNALSGLGGSIHDQLVWLQKVLTDMTHEIDTTVSTFGNTESLNNATVDQLLAEFQSTIGDLSGTNGPGPTWDSGNGPVTLAAVNNGNSGGGYGAAVVPAMDLAAAPGGVSGWIAQALTILEANGVPPGQLNTSDINLIIQHESGGNPAAVNTTDGNAAAGTPSTGLMQVIQPTFNAYALPGHGDITNPVDNIIAGVRYALARYGSLDNVPGVVAVNNGQPYVGY